MDELKKEYLDLSLQFCNNCNCQNFEICDIRKRLKNILEILKNSEK